MNLGHSIGHSGMQVRIVNCRYFFATQPNQYVSLENPDLVFQDLDETE